MKKLNLLFTALLLMCCVGTAKAVEVTIDGIKYDVITDTKQATVINYWEDGYYSGDIVIPSEITYNNVTCSVTSIGEKAFYYSSGLTSITIPNSVTSIGEKAFYYCSGLTSITIPNSVTSIGDYAFFECSRLTSITIPNSVTSIGDWAFSGCYRLTSITIPNSITSIGDYAFNNCSLTSITIPNSVTSIGVEAFYGCEGLTSITIPNSVTSIGQEAFAYCSNLTDVYCLATNVPATISNAFSGSYPESMTLHVPAEAINSYKTTEPWSSFGNIVEIFAGGEMVIDGIKYDINVNTKQATVISDDTKYSGDIVIPSEITYNNVTYSVTSIGEKAFYQCFRLKSITIPNSVTSIGSKAFEDCYGLTSVTIGNSVTSIGESAFEYCDGLTSITIPNSVTSIGKLAFYQCYRLTSVTIGNSVTSIGNQAFGDCSKLTSITIPNSVTSIGGSAFDGCSGLTSVTIGNSVTSIGKLAFGDCSKLTSITIPNSVTSIGGSAFYGCEGLESIVVEEGNTKYDSRNNCNAIIKKESNTLIAGCNNSVIPNSVTSIGSSAFRGCSGLTSITIPNSVTSIGEQAFESCDGLTSITIPNSVTSIGNNAFYYCSGLTSITIPNSVTSIGKYAFQDCSGLTSATIGNSVTSIGYCAFSNCENLADVYCLATNVPATMYNAFSGSYPESMTLHVPAEAINSYKTTSPWSTFGNIVTLDGDIVETPKCAAPVIEYYNGKLSFECETEGAEFVTEVTSNDFNKFYDSEINFSATYNISVYATATGHDNSDTVNATLCWIECDCSANDNTTEVINVPAKAVFVTSNNGTININCALEGEVVELYTSDAMYIGSTTIENGNATIESGLSKGDIAIIKIAEKSIKVILN